MIYTTFIRLCDEAKQCNGSETFIGELGWQAWMDKYIGDTEGTAAFVGTSEIVKDLTLIYDLSQLDFKGLKQRTKMSAAKFAALYRFSQRSVEAWCSGEREPAPYVLDFVRYAMFVREKEGDDGYVDFAE